MDAATELTWMYLQRPPQPDPPRQPADSQLLLLLRLWPLQVQGCKPCRPCNYHHWPTHSWLIPLR
ncbi:MAG TPA: hypothetical protein DEA38_08425 [Stenotrophomonas sp.]|nr:hypothetical protein [Stenotrophomonas sp.]